MRLLDRLKSGWIYAIVLTILCDYNSPEARYRHAAVAVNNQLWVVGGRDVYDRVIRSVNVYDIEDQRWRTFNDLNERFWVSDLGSFDYEGLAYFVGGFTSDYIAVPRVFSIDPVASWQSGSLQVVRRNNLWKRRGDRRGNLLSSL